MKAKIEGLTADQLETISALVQQFGGTIIIDSRKKISFGSFDLPSGRITEKKCDAMCEEFNRRMGELKNDFRVVCRPRYDYCAIDEYSQANRDNGGSSIIRTLKTGTARQCCEALQTYYYNIVQG